MKLDEPKALNRIAAYCSKAERCEYDVRRKLQGWELSEDATERIISRLKKERFLDDSRFVRGFVNDKLKFNKWGRTKIIYELRKRQIKEADYIDVLNEFTNDDYDKQLRHILAVKSKSVKAKDSRDKRNKLIRFALGRGFSMDSVIKSVNDILKNEDEE